MDVYEVTVFPFSNVYLTQGPVFRQEAIEKIQYPVYSVGIVGLNLSGWSLSFSFQEEKIIIRHAVCFYKWGLQLVDGYITHFNFSPNQFPKVEVLIADR